MQNKRLEGIMGFVGKKVKSKHNLKKGLTGVLA